MNLDQIKTDMQEKQVHNLKRERLLQSVHLSKNQKNALCKALNILHLNNFNFVKITPSRIYGITNGIELKLNYKIRTRKHMIKLEIPNVKRIIVRY
jgi:hypothetical protein